MIIPILGALLEGAGTIIDKRILNDRKINFKNYTVYGFLAIVLVMLPFIYFLWKVEKEAFSLINLSIFIFIIIISTLANILMCYAIKRESVSEMEPIRLMQPLFTILIAFILSFFFSVYSKEGNFSILILAIIASIALIVSHIKKHHLKFDKYILAAIFGSLFFAIELVTSRFLLSYYSSFSFYFLRCFFIFLITLIVFRPKISSVNNKSKFLILIVGIIWVVYRIILYYGYLKLGIVFTTMLFILSPIFVYIFAWIFLKEKLSWRNIISAIIIVGCVILAIGVQQGWFNFLLSFIK
jgi:drug/metabolite transporter (DMT)-like permease